MSTGMSTGMLTNNTTPLGQRFKKAADAALATPLGRQLTAGVKTAVGQLKTTVNTTAQQTLNTAFGPLQPSGVANTATPVTGGCTTCGCGCSEEECGPNCANCGPNCKQGVKGGCSCGGKQGGGKLKRKTKKRTAKKSPRAKSSSKPRKRSRSRSKSRRKK